MWTRLKKLIFWSYLGVIFRLKCGPKKADSLLNNCFKSCVMKLEKKDNITVMQI